MGTCGILVYQIRHEVLSCGSPDRLIRSCINLHPHVSLKRSYDLTMCTMFSKMFQCRKYYYSIAKYCIAKSTNYCYGLAWCLHRRIVYSYLPIATFLSKAYNQGLSIGKSIYYYYIDWMRSLQRTSDTLIGYLPIFHRFPKTSLCIRYHWYLFE